MLRSSGLATFVPQCLGFLAEAYLRTDRDEDALEIASEAIEMAEKNGERICLPELLRIRGLSLKSRQGEAERSLWQAIEVARGMEARMLELKAADSLADLLLKQGRHREAYELLEPTYSWFTEGFDTPDLRAAAGRLDDIRKSGRIGHFPRSRSSTGEHD